LTAILALPRPVDDSGGPVAFEDVLPIIQARCVACHAAKPTQEGIAAPPKGVILEQPVQIRALAAAINQQAAVARAMPPGNMTHITDAERHMIARWFNGGAQ
jgi:uncharacterized membrane protein